MKRIFNKTNFAEIPGLDPKIPQIPFLLILNAYTVTQLQTKCFRGSDLRKAGKFIEWRSIEAILRDPLMLGELITEILEQIDRMLKENVHFETGYTLTIEHDKPIGWSSTTLPGTFIPTDAVLERFKVDHWTRAMRFTPAKTHMHAPLTKNVTFELDFHLKPRMGWLVSIRSIYPGDMLEKGGYNRPITIDPKELVFFDWNHPGEKP